MAESKYINKVILGNGVKLDLTADTVTEDKLAAGVTAHDASGRPITGTSTFDADTSDATAAVAEVLYGKTYYGQGVKKTGTMPNRGKTDLTITERDAAVAIPTGFHDGSGTAGIDPTERAKLVPGNIKQGITVLGVSGTLEPSSEVTAQVKSVVPTFAEQSVIPDEGTDYLSEVKVAAIPVTEVENAAGGITLTVGA